MKTNRRKFLRSVGYGVPALLSSSSLFSCAFAKSPPNILFIMSDDHAAQAMSCYGSKLIETPHIDRIANEGMLFENSFVTNSICAPSRAVLLTGKYSHKNALHDNRDMFDGSQITFPKSLQTKGYQTAIAGKWHLKTEPTGFDNWQILIGQGTYYNPVFNGNGIEKNYTGYTTDLITDKAIEMLDNRDQERPFCLLVHHKAPHRNWMPHTKYLDKFADMDIPLPETFFDNYNGRIAAAEADMRIDDMYLSMDMKLQPGDYDRETGSGGHAQYAEKITEAWQGIYGRLTEAQKAVWDRHYDKINRIFRQKNLSGDALLRWKYQRYMKDYLRCVLSIDESTGRLLQYLDRNNLSENTIVIYTSDQGFYLGEHGWYDKRFMYEESLRMPLLMRYPEKIKAGSKTGEMVLNLDFAPTLLSYAGIDTPAEMQGRSFRPLAEGETIADWRKSIYYHYYEHPHGWHNVRRHYGVRTARYKLIHFYQQPQYWELYDLHNDPQEMQNVYTDPAYGSHIKDLKIELSRLQKHFDDNSFLESNKNIKKRELLNQ